MKTDQLAINSVSTRQDTLEQAIEAYATAGFTNVEFVLSHPKKHLDQGHSISDLRKLLDQHGLQCIGGFEGGITCFGDPSANDTLIANARLLGELGATALVVGTDGPPEDAPVEDPLGDMARVFAEVGQRIRDTGVNICIEFNWSPVVKSLRTAAEIAERSGVDNVGVLFDPAHYHCTPTKFDQINARTVPWIKHVHVNDMADKPGELSDCNADRALPGQGHLDLAGIFGAIEQHGYRGYFSIEMFSDELWAKPVAEAARLMYRSLLPLCGERDRT